MEFYKKYIIRLELVKNSYHGTYLDFSELTNSKCANNFLIISTSGCYL